MGHVAQCLSRQKLIKQSCSDISKRMFYKGWKNLGNKMKVDTKIEYLSLLSLKPISWHHSYRVLSSSLLECGVEFHLLGTNSLKKNVLLIKSFLLNLEFYKSIHELLFHE